MNKKLDYCERCMEYIDQKEVNGSFVCPECLCDDQITTFYKGDDEETEEEICPIEDLDEDEIKEKIQW